MAKATASVAAVTTFLTPSSGDEASATDRHEHAIRHALTELLPQLVCKRLRAFDEKRHPVVTRIENLRAHAHGCIGDVLP